MCRVARSCADRLGRRGGRDCRDRRNRRARVSCPFEPSAAAGVPLPSRMQEHRMADDKSKVGKQDRARVNKGEDYKVRHEAKKTGASTDRVREAAERAGPMRKDIEQDLCGRMKPRA